MNVPASGTNDPVALVLSQLDRVKPSGADQWTASCPCPDHGKGRGDRNPSLSIARGHNGEALLRCHARCGNPDIVAAIGLTMADLFPRDFQGIKPVKRNSNGNESNHKCYPTSDAAITAYGWGEPDQTWQYTDADGTVVGVVARWNRGKGKKIKPVSKRSRGWQHRAMPEPRPLYRLPEILNADSVWITEGEGCADAVVGLGLCGTTWAGGANAVEQTDWTPLSGKMIYILPDNDETGRDAAQAVAAILHALGCTVRVVEIPDLPDAGDIVDALDAHEWRMRTPGENREYLESLAVATPEWVPSSTYTTSQATLFRNAAGERSGMFEIIPASALSGGAEDIPFVWEGYLARGFTTLMTGLWKAGKSTLLAYMLKAFETGGNVGTKVTAARCLVVSEEGAGLWARRRDDLDIGDHAHFLIRPFLRRPTVQEWYEFVGFLAVQSFEAVVFDTIGALWPVPDENDASKVTAALMPLHAITNAGAAVLLIHHPRKGDASEGQASRGSGALPSFVDTIVELRRYESRDNEDRRRVLTAHSRFDETPRELAIELTDDGYRSVGTKADVSKADRLKTLVDLVSGSKDGMTVEQVHEDWPDDLRRPSLRTLRTDLRTVATEGLLSTSGQGTRGDPVVYFHSRP